MSKKTIKKFVINIDPSSPGNETAKVQYKFKAFEIGKKETITGAAEFDWDDQKIVLGKKAFINFITAPSPPAVSAWLPDDCHFLGDYLRDFITIGLGNKFWTSLSKEIQKAEGRNKFIRLALILGSDKLLSLPWEFLELAPPSVGNKNRRPLASMTHCLIEYATPLLPEAMQVKLTMHEEEQPGRMLFIWANPGFAPTSSNPSNPMMPDDHKKILRGENCKKLFTFDETLDCIENASWSKITTRLQDKSSNFIHFVCHGFTRKEDGVPGLVLAKDDDPTKPSYLMPEQEMRTAFIEAAYHLEMVVLCACYSGLSPSMANNSYGIAELLHKIGIPTIIASRFPIAAQAAADFAQEFYGSLKSIRGIPINTSESAAKARAVLLKNKKQLPKTRYGWASLMVFSRQEVRISGKIIDNRNPSPVQYVVIQRKKTKCEFEVEKNGWFGGYLPSDIQPGDTVKIGIQYSNEEIVFLKKQNIDEVTDLGELKIEKKSTGILTTVLLLIGALILLFLLTPRSDSSNHNKKQVDSADSGTTQPSQALNIKLQTTNIKSNQECSQLKTGEDCIITATIEKISGAEIPNFSLEIQISSNLAHDTLTVPYGSSASGQGWELKSGQNLINQKKWHLNSTKAIQLSLHARMRLDSNQTITSKKYNIIYIANEPSEQKTKLQILNNEESNKKQLRLVAMDMWENPVANTWAQIKIPDNDNTKATTDHNGVIDFLIEKPIAAENKIYVIVCEKQDCKNILFVKQIDSSYLLGTPSVETSEIHFLNKKEVHIGCAGRTQFEILVRDSIGSPLPNRQVRAQCHSDKQSLDIDITCSDDGFTNKSGIAVCNIASHKTGICVLTADVNIYSSTARTANWKKINDEKIVSFVPPPKNRIDASLHVEPDKIEAGQEGHVQVRFVDRSRCGKSLIGLPATVYWFGPDVDYKAEIITGNDGVASSKLALKKAGKVEVRLNEWDGLSKHIEVFPSSNVRAIPKTTKNIISADGQDELLLIMNFVDKFGNKVSDLKLTQWDIKGDNVEKIKIVPSAPTGAKNFKISTCSPGVYAIKPVMNKILEVDVEPIFFEAKPVKHSDSTHIECDDYGNTSCHFKMDNHIYTTPHTISDICPGDYKIEIWSMAGELISGDISVKPGEANNYCIYFKGKIIEKEKRCPRMPRE